MKSLKSNLLLSFILFTTIPLIIASSVILYEMYNEKYNAIYDRQYQILKLVEHDTNDFISNIEYLGKYVKDRYPVKKHNLLTGLTRIQKNISTILILNNDGILEDFHSNKEVDIFKGYDYSNTSYFKAIKNGAPTYWSDIFLPTTNTPSISYAIRIDKDTVAILIIDLSILNKFASKFKSDNNNAIVRIVDSKGQFLAHPAQKEFVTQRKSILNSSIYKKFISKGFEYKHIKFDGIKKENKIGIYGITKKQKWYVIVAENEINLLGTFNNLMVFIVIFILLLTIVSIYFSIKLSRSILNPIKDVSSNMNHIAHGNYMETNKHVNYEELGTLTNSFALMQNKIQEQTKVLLHKNRELEEAQKVAKLGSWSFDIKNNKITWSDEIYNILKIDKSIFTESYEQYLDHIHPEDKERFEKLYQDSLNNKQSYSIKYRLLIDDGEIKWIQGTWENKFDDNDPILSIGTIQDITKEQEQEKVLMEQSKLASMGEMIGNIAHQWRQPLNVISTGATGLKLQKEYGLLSDDKFIEACDAINDNAQYLSKTIDDFRDFIKGDRKKVIFNLNEDIKSFLHLVEGSIKSNDIKLIEDIQEDININGYPNELIQCFINIFNNAKDALKDIKEDRYIFISAYKQDEKVIITIKDNAGGIPEDVLIHIFEPYFTTKHKSVGTGLGLSMSYSLINDGMKGSLEASNTNYEFKENIYTGAQFKITLSLS
ncbi:MAG: PAS domain-containing protein [Campylobacterota bacterium]|nr:PAS domain-containing protein [Campylobacterota bacterium]